jgi:hypothetical protein
MKVVAMSEFVYEKLRSLPEGLIGRVISVHSELCNVLLNDGELLTMQTGRHLRTPMAMELPAWFGTPVDAGTPVHRLIGLDRLTCGEMELELGAAVLFASQATVQYREDCFLAAKLLATHLSSRLIRHSVFGYIASKAEPADDARISNPIDSTYCAMLCDATSGLLVAMQYGDVNRAIKSAHSFIGLGPGMTPAGDDFLQGFLLFAQASPAFHAIVNEVLANLRAARVLDTTLVSRALWQHFLAGRISSVAVALVNAYNLGDWEEFACQMRRIGEIGHSSGDDLLSGIWFAVSRLGPKPLAGNTGGI